MLLSRNKIFNILLLVSIFSISPQSYAKTYTHLADLTSFWKNEPVIGRWLSTGQGLIQIPNYMEQTSFPYKRSSFKKEVPFASGLTVVRLLGGWNHANKRGERNGQKDADLVYIHEGKLKYRWDLLKKRLDPYIKNGYKDLTLVLDNIPWDLAIRPKLIKPYGQVSPPHSLRQWEVFIETMMEQLVSIYGYNLVKHFRFRLGTENQHINRFYGTYNQYLNLYLSTQKAILKILPNAHISPFNFGGGKGEPSKTNIDIHKLLSPIQYNKIVDKPYISFLPISSYYVVKKEHQSNIKKLLDSRSIINKKYFNSLFKITQKTFPAEIHEFGVLNNTLGIHSDEPGVRGAAWRMYMIQNMIDNNISKLFHWGTFEQISKEKYLLKGSGWNYAVLEHLSGGEAYSLPAITTNNNIHHKTLIVKKKSKVYLLTTIFSDKKDDWTKENIIITMPPNLLENKTLKEIKWTYLTKSTSVMDNIHSDLYNNNLLKNPFLADLNTIGSVNNMGGYEGKQYVLKHWKHYTKLIIDSLSLKLYSAQHTYEKGELQFKIKIETPSVIIIELTL